MKIVKVQYTAKESFVEKNRENITRVMDELRSFSDPGIKYSVYLMNDVKSFMHLTLFENEEGQKILNSLESFQKFTTELKANGLETPPVAENPTLVGTSFDIF